MTFVILSTLIGAYVIINILEYLSDIKISSRRVVIGICGILILPATLYLQNKQTKHYTVEIKDVITYNNITFNEPKTIVQYVTEYPKWSGLGKYVEVCVDGSIINETPKESK